MDNIFFREMNATEQRHLSNNPLFRTFCIASKSIATSSSNEDEMVAQARAIYVDQFKITDPPWNESTIAQWRAFYGKLRTPILNVYFSHVNDPSGTTNRGPKFTEFIQQSHRWSELYEKETAIATAQIAYNAMIAKERKIGTALTAPIIYPAWCPVAWEAYFYDIECTDACRQRMRKRRRLDIEEKSADVMEKATDVILAQMNDGSTEDVKNVTSAYASAAQVYQRLYINNTDDSPKKNM
jgi:hypothetical protein